jgi:hypothetical protein
MLVKIMSGENLQDTSPNKHFELFDDVRNVTFDRSIEGVTSAYITLRNGDVSVRIPEGNIYLMTDTGKTFETFCAPPSVVKSKKAA